METIGSLARRFGLSRSTLLYYDRIGLLTPSGRSRANYRLYHDDDVERLAKICTYREAGLPLADIRELLTSGGSIAEALERRLEALNEEISARREQQRVIVSLLQNRRQLDKARALDKERWVALLRATGLDDDDMDRWHAEFERLSPQAHQDFLEALGIGAEEVQRIREDARESVRARER